jgi:superfamily I DNA and/or RNA helicase
MFPFCKDCEVPFSQCFNFLFFIVMLLLLLDIVRLPMEDELVRYQSVGSPISGEIEIETSEMDASQLEAVRTALSQRVTLIQGPPGTGKTFVSVHIARASLQNPENKILILSYTHHALDNLLERIIDMDHNTKDEIVRFGNPKKVSRALENCCFQDSKDVSFSKDDRCTMISLKENIRTVIAEVEESKEKILNFSTNNWEDVKDLLTSEECRQLNSDQTIYKKWMRGLKRPSTLKLEDSDDLWMSDRKARIQFWWHKWAKDPISSLLQNMKKVNRFKKELSSLKKEYTIENIREKRILACTTTYAAMNRDFIDSCSPTVILVEEAAEIHESHILTNLSMNVRRLVMVGDHKQLKPKLENYKLRTESGYGINFDVSLFERLVRGNYPYKVLNIQQRMIPTISEFIRMKTYPQLEDAPRVSGRQDIKGTPSNILFINHNEPEDGKRSSNSEIGLPDSSKTNQFEAHVALNLVEYFIQQGYKAEDIVVLTPYLGQLVLIRSLIKKSHHLDAKLTEMDYRELMEQMALDCSFSDSDYDEFYYSSFVGLEVSSCITNSSKKASTGSVNRNKKSTHKKGENTNQNSIRVATIDNFQGEEAKIIIVSLVRSNSQGNIGFMKVPERVNVLMSRARDGLFMIGNAKTFVKSHHAKDVWIPIIEKFITQKCFREFPDAEKPETVNIKNLFTQKKSRAKESICSSKKVEGNIDTNQSGKLPPTIETSDIINSELSSLLSLNVSIENTKKVTITRICLLLVVSADSFCS